MSKGGRLVTDPKAGAYCQITLDSGERMFQLGLGIHNAQIYRELGDLSRALEEKVSQRTGQLEEANRRLQ